MWTLSQRWDLLSVPFSSLLFVFQLQHFYLPSVHHSYQTTHLCFQRSLHTCSFGHHSSAHPTHSSLPGGNFWSLISNRPRFSSQRSGEPGQGPETKPQGFMLGKWAPTGFSWANPCVHLPSSAPGRGAFLVHQSMGWALLGTDLLSSGLGPVDQDKVLEWTLEVKAGDLSFILGNLSIKLFIGELHLLYDVTCFLPSRNNPGGANEALSVTATRGTKAHVAQTSGFTAKHFIFRRQFELFGTNIPSIITAALSNAFTVDYLKWSSCLTGVFFLHCEMEQINVKC